MRNNTMDLAGHVSPEYVVYAAVNVKLNHGVCPVVFRMQIVSGAAHVGVRLYFTLEVGRQYE